MLETIGHMFDPLMLLGVVAGAFLVATLQNGVLAFGRAIAALAPLVAADPDADRTAARAAMLKVDHFAEMRGLACTDRIRTAQRFVAAATRKLANCDRVDQFETWASQTISDRVERHARVHGWWNAVADAGPAIGMACTIIGLIRMFTAMDDPATIGPAMALALLTTLYGVILANMIAGPIAARLADLSAREIGWQRELADRMIAVARRETAGIRRQSFREVNAA